MPNLRLALRTLFKTPFVTVVAILSLALGIGANAAIFSLFNQMLLRPLPVREPNRLVTLAATGPKPGSTSCNQAGDCDVVFSYPMFRDLEKVQTVLTGIAAHRLFGANLAARGQTLNGDGLLVSQRRFGADPDVINQTLIVNGQVMTIVGVAPRGFDGTTLGARAEVFVPITMRGFMTPGFKGFDNRRAYWAYLFARLEPGVSVDEGRTALNGQYRAIINDVEAPLQKGMSEQTLARFKSKPILVEPGPRGQSGMTREAKAPLTLLLGVTAFVLVIACANIANLLLARAATRAPEMAVRLSMGASRRQLVTQLIGESCLLALFGGAAGLVVAQWTLNLMASILPAEAADTVPFRVDVPVMIFAALLTLGTGFLFGLFPALHSTRSDLVSALKGQAGQPSGARTAARFRTALATAQIALSMALLVSAGLFTKSLFNVSRVQLGLTLENVIMFQISPGLNGYSPERSRGLFERLEDELAAVPGVNGVVASMVPLLSGSNWGNSVAVEGFDAGPDTDTESRYNEVGPGYFATLGIPLISGREFTRADAAGAPKVAIVNEAFARKFKLGRDAVGKHIGDRGGKLDTDIVGLVQNAKYSEVKAEVPPVFFRPYRQDEQLTYVTFYVRTSLDPERFLSSIPKVVTQLDPNLPVVHLRTMPQQVQEHVVLDRFISTLSAAFACLATLLAAVGLYGVLAYTVAQRTQEIGLRMALGATPTRVRTMMLRKVALMTLVGGTIGLTAAIGLGRLAESLLYELKGSDPLVLLGAAVVSGLIGCCRSRSSGSTWSPT
ncbi:MAG: ABC transporter permease, partial [Acidobacteria bacterium]|nr:ABC transporter permease [Acidobacteriota bacterium]